jgi:hypothetical protein
MQGLHFLAAVRWKVSCENPGRFVAAHFLAAHSAITAFILRGPIFSLSTIRNIIQPRRKNSQGTDFIILGAPC